MRNKSENGISTSEIFGIGIINVKIQAANTLKITNEMIEIRFAINIVQNFEK
jgi:hypothetical protein